MGRSVVCGCVAVAVLAGLVVLFAVVVVVQAVLLVVLAVVVVWLVVKWWCWCASQVARATLARMASSGMV